MDSRWREILREHRYDSSKTECSCGLKWNFDDAELGAYQQYLDHIDDIYDKLPKTRGKGMEHFPVPDDAEQAILPPQRSMTPEESANLAAYHKTIFKRVVAQGDELREEVPIIHGRAELAVHDAALRASVREECANAAMEAFGHNETNLPHSDGCIACAVKQAILALASEKVAPEEVAQASDELGVCNHFPQGPPHRRRNHSNNTNFPCVGDLCRKETPSDRPPADSTRHLRGDIRLRVILRVFRRSIRARSRW